MRDVLILRIGANKMCYDMIPCRDRRPRLSEKAKDKESFGLADRYYGMIGRSGLGYQILRGSNSFQNGQSGTPVLTKNNKNTICILGIGHMPETEIPPAMRGVLGYWFVFCYL